MNGATRHTTRAARGDLLESVCTILLLRPATVAAGLTALTLVRLHASRPLTLTAALVVWFVTTVALNCYRQFGMVPRLRRAMTELGLVYRNSDDVIQCPRVRGRRHRSGRNLRLRW